MSNIIPRMPEDLVRHNFKAANDFAEYINNGHIGGTLIKPRVGIYSGGKYLARRSKLEFALGKDDPELRKHAELGWVSIDQPPYAVLDVGSGNVTKTYTNRNWVWLNHRDGELGIVSLSRATQVYFMAKAEHSDWEERESSILQLHEWMDTEGREYLQSLYDFALSQTEGNFLKTKA